jgi:hypothetical protein
VRQWSSFLSGVSFQGLCSGARTCLLLPPTRRFVVVSVVAGEGAGACGLSAALFVVGLEALRERDLPRVHRARVLASSHRTTSRERVVSTAGLLRSFFVVPAGDMLVPVSDIYNGP